MALSHSPQIVTDGLAFYYDMNNPQKSWRGKPTTNLYAVLAGIDLNNYNGWSMPGVPGASSQIVTEYGSWNGNTVWRVSVGVGTVAGFASWRQCLPAGYDSTYGTTRRITAKVKMLKGNISSLGRHNGGGTSGATYVPIDPSQVSSTITDKNGWFLLDSNVSGSYPSGHCVGIGILSQDIEFLVAEMGVYPESFSVPYTSTVRSNTQAILDLAGNNTVTANSLSYLNDGTFEFLPNDVSSTVSVPLSTALNKLQGTINMWVYPRSYSGSNGLFVNRDVATSNALDWLWIGSWSSGSLFYFRLGNGADCCSQDLTVSSWSSLCPANVWTNVCVTWSSGQFSRIYVNGQQAAARTITAIPNTNPSATGRIGLGHASGASGSWHGKIESTQIYNKALSAQEVQQNFNALRSRYSI